VSETDLDLFLGENVTEFPSKMTEEEIGIEMHQIATKNISHFAIRLIRENREESFDHDMSPCIEPNQVMVVGLEMTLIDQRESRRVSHTIDMEAWLATHA